MAFLNAAGAPVARQPITIQIDVPAEEAPNASLSALNFLTIIMALGQLFMAMKSGNPAAITAAIQALIMAIFG